MRGKGRQGKEGDGKEREGVMRLKIERGMECVGREKKMKQIHLNTFKGQMKIIYNGVTRKKKT